MASSMSLKLACLAILCLVAAAPQAQGAITCGQVISNLAPCIAYVRSNGAGGGVPAPCCNGIRSLNNAARTTPDLQSACNCIKGVAAGIPGINFGLTNRLPGMCGVNIPYKISPTTDCKSVK
ncbi:ARABIDOPSIS THALIANA LIPID TRANSFER PROTEIN 1, lipid transfer protein 1, LIPID TRANSFER PROTEIN 1 [Hibiscus trionum]|uniref:Non-specific lipid-transfer protein n=1 Tax=Hibiscus trionum TaxID=183268 RepID=A0A9W7ME14_HIBTR|nr:ARABIDOPSIS THALIANA LIPID TRANSFER PROTEIN 1, lipid transfer protein 1, LIPID TRANSFER PROTEIN 1 [Hibiscus trionum]